MPKIVGAINIAGWHSLERGGNVGVSFDMPIRGTSALVEESTVLFLWDDGVVTWQDTRGE